jgi:hypothetical protein
MTSEGTLRQKARRGRDLLTVRYMTPAEIADLVERTRESMRQLGSDDPCIATRLARFTCRFAALEDIRLLEAHRRVIALARFPFAHSAVYRWWDVLYPGQRKPGRT